MLTGSLSELPICVWTSDPHLSGRPDSEGPAPREPGGAVPGRGERAPPLRPTPSVSAALLGAARPGGRGGGGPPSHPPPRSPPPSVRIRPQGESGADQRRSHMGPSCGTSWMRSSCLGQCGFTRTQGEIRGFPSPKNEKRLRSNPRIPRFLPRSLGVGK